MKEKIPTSRKAKKLQRPMSKLKAAGKSRNQDLKKKKKKSLLNYTQLERCQFKKKGLCEL